MRRSGSTPGPRRSLLTRRPIPDGYTINADWYPMTAAALAGHTVTLPESLAFRRVHPEQSMQTTIVDPSRVRWTIEEKARMADEARKLAPDVVRWWQHNH